MSCERRAGPVATSLPGDGRASAMIVLGPPGAGLPGGERPWERPGKISLQRGCAAQPIPAKVPRTGSISRSTRHRRSATFPAPSGCGHGSRRLQHSYARYRVSLCRAARANRDYPSKSCDCHPGDGRASSIQILGPRKPMWTERVNAHRPLQGRFDAYLRFVAMYLPMRWTKGAGSGT